MNETWWVSKDQLIGEQLGVIGLPLEGSYLILGPPGSGKTNLLLLRANYVHLSGHPEIAVIVYTRTLQEFLAAGAAQYDFPASKILTSIRWFIELLKDYGRTIPKSDDFLELRRLLLEAAQALVKEKKLTGLWDAILLDEAQDYLPEEIEFFGRLASRLFVVADSRQKIYEGADALRAVTSLVDETRVLKHHFRNGIKICRMADSIGKDSSDYEPMEATANYDEAARPSSVDHHRCDDLQQQIEKIMEKLDVQRKTYPDELLGICCPRNDEVDAVWHAIRSSPFADIAVLQKGDHHSSFSPDSRVCVATIHAAKGLEFRALHLAGLEQLKKFPHRRNISFTAVTRAKTSLSLYYSGSIPSFLEKAIAKLAPLPDLPEISAVFGKGK